MSEDLVIYRISEVVGRTGLSRATIYRLAAIDAFPKPCKLGARSTGWSSLEIDEWMRKCLQRRAHKTGPSA